MLTLNLYTILEHLNRTKMHLFRLIFKGSLLGAISKITDFFPFFLFATELQLKITLPL